MSAFAQNVDALRALRSRAAHFFAALLWLHVPVVIAIAHANHTPARRAACVMMLAATIGSLAVRFWGGDWKARVVIAAALTFAPILMVYAAQEGPWQVDYHMYFFVVFGMLLAFVDVRPLAIAALVTSAHHLLLAQLFPGAIFPGADATRAALHIVIVLVDGIVLFWIVRQMKQLFVNAENSLRVARDALASSELLKSVVLHVNDAVIISEMRANASGLPVSERRIIYVNQAFTRMSGYSDSEIIGGTLDPLRGRRSNPSGLEACLQTVARTGSATYSDVWYAPDGREIEIEASIVGVSGGWTETAEMVRVINISRDVTGTRRAAEAVLRAQIAEEANAALTQEIQERLTVEQRLAFAAYHDGLTGLANRSFFRERLDDALAASGGAVPEPAVLFIDLDRFKVVNDSLGHLCGDLLLKAVAERLTGCLRDEDMLARLGGDEFAVLIERPANPGELDAIAKRLLDSFAAPFEIEARELYAAASIGIANGRNARSDEVDDLMRNADLAMYRAKAGGRGRYASFEPSLLENSTRLLQLDTQLHQALERSELVAFYQPIVALSTERLCGFEALVRWRHPVVGMIQPDEFIKTAEETGLIFEIGQFMLDRACSQLRIWLDTYRDHPDLWISVNASVRELCEAAYADAVIATLKRHAVPANSVHIEITESTIASDFAVVEPVLSKLRAFGMRISIDDFGTGFSSLQYLDKLPIDTLKIDRSFVSGRGEGIANLKLVRTIVNLANELGLDIVCEGVESAAQAEVLRALTHAYGQGYLYSRPLEVDAAAAFFEARTGRARERTSPKTLLRA